MTLKLIKYISPNIRKHHVSVSCCIHSTQRGANKVDAGPAISRITNHHDRDRCITTHSHFVSTSGSVDLCK